MTEITDQHREWATVDRMRIMLESPYPGYEVTHTYTVFAGILCWTLQRIRRKKDDTILAAKFASLRDKLKNQQIEKLVSTQSTVLNLTPALNDLSGFKEIKLTERRYLGALIALRDAVAHGDARYVWPINDGSQLVGYKFLCGPREKDGKREWEVPINLDRFSMGKIAGDLARQFCDAAISPDNDDDLAVARLLSEAA